ncbi:MAG: hypothetical protein ACO3JL_21745, partial [Myxococcota bacterium]
MSVNDILSLTPAGFFALGALLCLLFEATGTPVGARKQGERLHITLLTLSACAAVLVQVVTTWSLADAPWLSFGGALVVDRVTLGAQAGVGVLVGLAAFAATSG